jgi:hypothetical protein
MIKAAYDQGVAQSLQDHGIEPNKKLVRSLTTMNHEDYKKFIAHVETQRKTNSARKVSELPKPPGLSSQIVDSLVSNL